MVVLNKEVKTFDYEFYDSYYNLVFEIGKYQNNGRKYIGLVSFESIVEPFSDFTINIPMYMFENDNEIILSNDIEDDLIELLVNMGIIKCTGKFAYSGFSKYRVVEFYEDKAKEYIYWKEV